MAQDSLEKLLYISGLAWERLRVPPEELEKVAGDRGTWDTALYTANATLLRTKCLRRWMDGVAWRMHGHIHIYTSKEVLHTRLFKHTQGVHAIFLKCISYRPSHDEMLNHTSATL